MGQQESLQSLCRLGEKLTLPSHHADRLLTVRPPQEERLPTLDTRQLRQHVRRPA